MDGHVHEHVKTYLDACARSSKRARDILVLLIITTVLLFGAFWNSRSESWTGSRILQDERSLALPEMQPPCVTLPNSAKPCATVAAAPLNSDEAANARAYLDERPSLKGHPATVAAALEKLEGIQTDEIYYVRLPFFGIVFDVNDAGAIGGFALVTLFLWLRMALWREFHNIKDTFGEARAHGCMRFCYQALAMQQLLSIPPSLRPEHGRDAWTWVIRLYAVLPLVVQSLYFAFDARTFDAGWTLNHFDALFEIAWSFVFLVLTMFLIRNCDNLSTEINKEWAGAAGEILLADLTRSKEFQKLAEAVESDSPPPADLK